VDDYPVATVRMVDGRLVLDDPMALAMIKAVEKHNCRNTLSLNLDRVTHFVRRIAERGMAVEDVVITVLNVDDPNGGRLAEALMPGTDWQPFRDKGQVPFARGLAMREGIQELLDMLDPEAGKKLREVRGRTAIVVMDYGVVEIFDVDAPKPAAVMGPDFDPEGRP
jgi:hypothetical protein